MKKQTIVTAAAAVGAAAALGLGGAALAQAGQSPAGLTQSVAHPTASGAPTAAPGEHGRKHAPGLNKEAMKERILEHGLTGDTAVKVTQAAVAKEPTAYLLRVWKAADGTYRAHMMRPDGTRVIVTVDASFTATGVENAPVKAPGQGKPGKGDTSTASPSATS